MAPRSTYSPRSNSVAALHRKGRTARNLRNGEYLRVPRFRALAHILGPPDLQDGPPPLVIIPYDWDS
jgi:hypothetical protein